LKASTSFNSREFVKVCVRRFRILSAGLYMADALASEASRPVGTYFHSAGSGDEITVTSWIDSGFLEIRGSITVKHACNKVTVKELTPVVRSAP
jgi:hypothetical protein